MNYLFINIGDRDSETAAQSMRFNPPASLFQQRTLSAMVATLVAGISMVSSLSLHAEDAVVAKPQSADSQSVATDSTNDLAQDSSNTLDAVVVTSRKREELAQSVPLPETVIGSKTLERDGTVTMSDIAQKAPNLLVSASNSRQTSVAIRGLGKNSGNEAIQGSVGIIIDGVVLSQAGMSFTNLVDLDRVEVLRGPQGTLQGKNTTLGAINITTKAPSFTPQYAIEAGYGSRNTFDGKASATGPIVDGLLAYRASFYATDGDGQIKNIYAPLGNSWQGPDRQGGRFQLLFTPTDDLTARLIMNFDASEERTNLSPYISDPSTFANGTSRTANNGLTYTSRLSRSYFGGYQPLIGDITRSEVDLNSAKSLPVHQAGVSLEVNKTFGEYTLTSITAFRYNDFDFRNDFDYTHFDIQHLSGTLGNTSQYSQELRLASPIGPAVDYQVGLFAMSSESYTLSRTLYGQDAGAFYASNSQYNALVSNTALLQSSLNGVYSTTEVDPTSESVAAFGQTNWHLTDKATLTLGLRETYETVGNTYNKLVTGGTALTNTNALAIRNGQLGTVYGYVTPASQSNQSLSWLINPSYKLSDDVLLYGSGSHGTKSGAVQLGATGQLADVAPEQSLDFELGFKSSWLAHSLFFNANLYKTQITDYQTTATVANTGSNASTTPYVSQLTNVGGVRMRGLEIDGAWNATNHLSLTYGGAYNLAAYSDYKNATCPIELNLSASTLCNFTGKQVASAPRVTYNLGVDYKKPISDKLIGHVFLNDVYRSRANLSSTLSEYTWQGGYSVTNGGIGVVTQDGKYELNLIAKNLFDTKYAVNLGQYSNTAGVSEFWGDARYVGLVFRDKF